MRAEVLIRIADGTVHETVSIETDRRELALSIDPRLEMRCVDPSGCSVERRSRSRRAIVSGSRIVLRVEGALDDPSEAHPFVGDDRIELTSYDAWIPRVRDRAHELDLAVSIEGDLGLASVPALLGNSLAPEEPWVILGMPQLTTVRRACESGEQLILSYDAAFQLAAEQLEAAACDALESLVPILGAPVGSGPFTLLVAPRGIGAAYYVEPRGLIVPSHFGGFRSIDAARTYASQSSGADPRRLPHAERLRMRRLATTHEIAHAFWTSAQHYAWPALGEAIAQYLSFRVLRDAQVPVEDLVAVARARLALPSDHVLNPYDRGLVILTAIEIDRGRAAVDEFLRGTRRIPRWHRGSLRALAEQTIGLQLLTSLTQR